MDISQTQFNRVKWRLLSPTRERIKVRGETISVRAEKARFFRAVSKCRLRSPLHSSSTLHLSLTFPLPHLGESEGEGASNPQGLTSDCYLSTLTLPSDER